MKEKAKKIMIVLCIGGFLIYCLYLIFHDGNADIADIRNLCALIFSSCTLLSMTFSTRVTPPIPEELLDNQEYLEAKERQDNGGKILIVGTVMIVAPIILLFILGELHDFLATAGLISFFVGILAILIGVLVTFGAGKDLAKFPIEMVQDAKPESKASVVFSNIGTLAAVAVPVLWIIETIILK